MASDHSHTEPKLIELQRKQLFTSLEARLIQLQDAQSRARAAASAAAASSSLVAAAWRGCAPRRLLGWLLTLAVLWFSVVAIFVLVKWEQSVLLTELQNDAKYLIVPIIIAITKNVGPKVLSFAVEMEGYRNICMCSDVCACICVDFFRDWTLCFGGGGFVCSASFPALLQSHCVPAHVLCGADCVGHRTRRRLCVGLTAVLRNLCGV